MLFAREPGEEWGQWGTRSGVGGFPCLSPPVLKVGYLKGASFSHPWSRRSANKTAAAEGWRLRTGDNRRRGKAGGFGGAAQGKHWPWRPSYDGDESQAQRSNSGARGVLFSFFNGDGGRRLGANDGEGSERMSGRGRLPLGAKERSDKP